MALSDLAEAYRRDGRYARAEPLYGRLLASVEQKPGILTDEVRAGLAGYAQMLRKMKRKSEARGLGLQLKSLAPR